MRAIVLVMACGLIGCTGKATPGAGSATPPTGKVGFDVMDVPGEVEREEGYWSAKRGDKEIIEVLRATEGTDEGRAAVVIWTPEIATVDAVKVTSITGHATSIVDTDTACRSASEKHIAYFLNAEKAKGQAKPPKLVTGDIVAIAQEL